MIASSASARTPSDLEKDAVYTLDGLSSRIDVNRDISGMGYCPDCNYLKDDRLYQSLESKANKKVFRVSVLSPEEALSIFNQLKINSTIRYDSADDGCYARAHMAAWLLEDKKIMKDRSLVTAKIFLKGNLFLTHKNGDVSNWDYHVANVMYVRKGEEIQLMVFDPALFDRPVSKEDWKKKLLENRKSKFYNEFFTNRFSMTTDDFKSLKTRYEDRDFDEVKKALKNPYKKK